MYPPELRILLGETEAPLKAATSETTCSPAASDWLSHNNLTRRSVLRSLAMIRKAPESFERPPSHDLNLSFSAEEAWNLCAQALESKLTYLREVISEVKSAAPKSLEPNPNKYPRPFTFDLGAENLPFISIHYRNRPSDLIAMAHEFGHAIQISASWKNGTGQMPPVARECCAFIAELAAMQCCGARSLDLNAVHNADDVTYFGENRESLEDALCDEQLPYRYEWNYPLARFFAGRISRSSSPGTLSMFFGSAQEGGLWFERFIKRSFSEVKIK